MRVVYGLSGGLYSQWLDGMNHTVGIETISTTGASNTMGFTGSAVADSDYGTHLLFESGNITYSYRASSGSGWTSPSNVFSNLTGSYPTTTVDLSTNDVYAFALYSQNNSIVMKRKPLGLTWSDQSAVFPVTNLPQSIDGGPNQLGSNYASASGTNSSRLLLVWNQWTNVNGQSLINVMFT